MCYEVKVRYYTCGDYGKSTWRQCDIWPAPCGHTLWGVPYEQGGLGSQEDIVIHEDCPWHRRQKEPFAAGIEALPEEDE